MTGPTGVGKSYLAAALAHAACRADFAVSCFRLPRVIEELARYAALQKRSALFRRKRLNNRVLALRERVQV